MKKWFDTNYFKAALYALSVIILSILFYQLVSNLGLVSISIDGFLNTTTKVLTPILYGALFAFLMNPGVSWFEKKIYVLTKTKPSKTDGKPYRSYAILLVYLVLFGFIFISFNYMVPKIFANIRDLYNNVPQYIKSIEQLLLDLEDTKNYAAQYLPKDYLEDLLNSVQLSKITPNFINSLVGRIFTSAISLTSVTLNIILACVIAFYLVKQKESFAIGTTRLMYAIFPKEKCDKVISLAKESNYIFSKFFIGKSLDSLIIGIICFIGLSILKNRYALLLALIVGITNMIPYFGPFIGGVPAVIITLFEGFMPAVFVAIFIFILQQFDGLFLGPKILGDSIGLSPLWIITSIIIGGALWGTLGMFFGVPLCAIILLLINRWIDKRLEVKDIILSEDEDI